MLNWTTHLAADSSITLSQIRYPDSVFHDLSNPESLWYVTSLEDTCTMASRPSVNICLHSGQNARRRTQALRPIITVQMLLLD